ncbi:hypothetical protein, unlikely [Trypanosoma congolense IL3000]|uniref:Uncharacterized protein n=1 Tax=Trypanosoma congolense (strain IL3000) TaxID=1068625 RepID=F9WFX3_TRYCI|nr:hypothetical protein, unlikely [Trypanosoma congolense IL3000]
MLGLYSFMHVGRARTGRKNDGLCHEQFFPHVFRSLPEIHHLETVVLLERFLLSLLFLFTKRTLYTDTWVHRRCGTLKLTSTRMGNACKGGKTWAGRHLILMVCLGWCVEVCVYVCNSHLARV